MITTALRVLTALFISVLAASCAQGTSAVENLGDAGTSSSLGTPMCGNGKVETGEMCECEAGTTDHCIVRGTDCSSLNTGSTGPLLCDPKTCVFIDDMCSNGSGGTGGQGTGGTES